MLCLASEMLRYKRDNTGKIHALCAMQHGEALSAEEKLLAAPYLKGNELFQFLVEAKGIDGMLKHHVPIKTIQEVVARCMKEKDALDDQDAAKGIWGFVEFFKSTVVTDRLGVPDFIIEMGYEEHFPSKWAQPTAKNMYNAMKPLPLYLPSLPCFEPITETSDFEHTSLFPPLLKCEEVPFDHYYNRLANLASSVSTDRFQEGLAFGCDILQYYPDGGEKALDVFLLLAEIGGALYSHHLATECMEKAKQVADPKNKYHCARIASVGQTVFRHWGCFEEEARVFYQHNLRDSFSKYSNRALSAHLDSQFELLINNLALRVSLTAYHRCCSEECHQSWTGQYRTLDILKEI
jgi:hypothetical protein